MRLPLYLLVSFSGLLAQLSPPRTSKFKCLSNGCCDEHEWCRFWASIGECSSNQDWMLVNCQLACDSCIRDVPSAPESAAESDAKCIPIMRDPKNAIEELKRNNLITTLEDVSFRVLLSIDDVTKAVSNGCVPKLKTSDCSKSLCYHLAYRSLDGTCNNLDEPVQGAAFQPYLRLLPATYDDGIAEPVSSLHMTRPSAREASRILLSSRQSILHDKYNSFLMQWGQFISHDTAKTTLQPSSPCKTCIPVPSRCMIVRISPRDLNTGFQRRGCLKISRSAPVCGTGRISPREQLNENTAFVDASTLYGSSLKDLHKFRDGRTGFLKMKRFNNQLVLPFDQSKCITPDKCTATFTAGDIRVNMFIGLSSMHILFAREHNRIATVLQRLNPSWSGDRLFHETRKIVGAEVQVILFKEFLPKVLGNSFSKVIGAYKGYDPNVNPSISNVFTTAAYRFGHGMLEEFYKRIDLLGRNVSHGGFEFGEGIFKSKKILFEGGIDPILRGFMLTPVKRPHRMTPSITEKMFGSTDLGSINIQRGRDHGLSSYNQWRHFCGKPLANTFEDLKEDVLEQSIRDALARNYRTPNDVDLYIGAMVEDPVIGGLVGPTIACIIGDQFKRLRDGDRFYFENPGIFTPNQVKELRKTTLSRVICDNGDHFETITEDAFLLPQGKISSCSALPSIDLTNWLD